jgi:protein CpxP
VRISHNEKDTSMKSIFKPLLLAGLLTTVGFSALAQAPTPIASDSNPMAAANEPTHKGMRHDRMGKRSREQMQAHMDKRHAAFKASLKLTAAQEGAWATFTAAMAPPAKPIMNSRAERAEISKLPTPERLDKMKAMHTEHMTMMTAEMDKHGDATKAFYATLTPEQQKTFDTHGPRSHGDKDHKHGMRDDKAAGQLKS